MTPTVGSAALPDGTSVALASGGQRPVEELAPGAVIEDGGVVTSVMELPPDAIVTGNSFYNLAVGVVLGTYSTNWNVQPNVYSDVSTNVSNSGAGNSIGVATD